MSAPVASSSSQIQPSPYGILVDPLGPLGQRVVHRGDGPGHRCVDLRHRLRRLHLAELSSDLDHAADRGQVDEDDVAQRVLGVVGDTDTHVRSLQRAPTRARPSNAGPRGYSWGATISDRQPIRSGACLRRHPLDPLAYAEARASDASRSAPSAQTCVTGFSGSGTTSAQPSSDTTLIPSTRTSCDSSSLSCSIRVRMIRPFCSRGDGTSRWTMGIAAPRRRSRPGRSCSAPAGRRGASARRCVEGREEGREHVPATLVRRERHATRRGDLEQSRR